MNIVAEIIFWVIATFTSLIQILAWLYPIIISNKIYRKNYKIDFKNRQIFELNNFDSKKQKLIDFEGKQLIELEEDELLNRTLEHFKIIDYDNNTPNLKEIEQRIFYGNYFKKGKTKKNFLISASDDNIHYLVDNNFLNNFFKYKETYYNDNDYSVTHVYLDNKNETYYKIITYSIKEYYTQKKVRINTNAKLKCK